MKNDELLHKWVNNTISAEELEMFKLRPEYLTLEELKKNTQDLNAPEFDEADMLKAILNTGKESPVIQAPERRIFLANWIKYAAAAAVLFLAIWYFIPESSSMIHYDLAKGERQEDVLPDQSSFILNAESSLSYDAGQWKNNRSLDLKGEAFFKVEKGAKFTVNTPSGSVEVLGTSFNVRSRQEGLEVKCFTGKVAVRSLDKSIDETIIAKEAIRIEAGIITDQWTVQSETKPNWVEGIFSFKNVPLSTVIKELERQFDINIEQEGINVEELITCNFQNKNLDQALKTSITPLGIQYKILKDQSVKLFKE